jgi:translation initiation factor 1
MNKKKVTGTGGIIFSTDPSFKFDSEEAESTETLNPAQQKLKVRLDTKQRAGKAVTLIEGYTGKETDLEELGKKLKTFCGTGGSVKDNQVIIQGDQRDKVLQWLLKNDFKNTKKI